MNIINLCNEIENKLNDFYKLDLFRKSIDKKTFPTWKSLGKINKSDINEFNVISECEMQRIIGYCKANLYLIKKQMEDK